MLARDGASPLPQVIARQLRSQRMDVVAVVPVVWDRRAVRERPDGGAQVAHLGAEVVEVVLARRRVTGRVEDAAEEVADEGAPSVPDVEGTGRVGRDELDVRRATGTARPGAVGGAGV